MLPEDLRNKVEDYLDRQADINLEIERMDAMLKAASNSWAQQRATGMATKLNHELKQQRKLRQQRQLGGAKQWRSYYLILAVYGCAIFVVLALL